MFGKLFNKQSQIGNSKRPVSKESKKERWKRFPGRLYNALESNVYDDQISQLKENISMFPNLVDEKRKKRLLRLSIQSGSKECAEYFLNEGINLHQYRNNLDSILHECKYDKIVDVYNLLKELLDKYPEILINERISLDKITLIKRLIDPSKIEDNQKRVDYLLENMEFFGSTNIIEVINENYKDNSKMTRLKSLIREIKLKDLGI